MRDYAKVAPQFWTGKTGKALKAAGPETVIVGLYLMTSPHANMIGVYHCPLAYIAFDTGLGLEGASKGLQSAIEADFCTYEAESDYVFVHEFAAYQIGDELDPKDNRCKGVKSEIDKVPKGKCWQGFRARYAVPFNLPPAVESASPSKAPPKPGAGTGEETGSGVQTHTPLALDWALPKAWGEWAIGEFPHWTPEVVRSIAGQFADHQRSKAAESADWQATWRKWCRDDLTQKAHPAPKPKAEKVAQPVGITVPSTDTGAQKFAAEMDERAATATKPPASLVALVRRPQGEAA
jgi:hypothetical protein